MKLLFILGTRPEAIKLFPIIKKFQENNNVFDTHICITAQHREMVDDLFNLFNLKADFDLNIMSENQCMIDADIITINNKARSG